MTDLWTLDRAVALALGPDDFSVGRRIETRWRDNDAYGHVNNALYYEFFDTAINTWLWEQLPDSPSRAGTQMFVAESGCRFYRELAFPAPLLVSHRVAAVGRSSITYELAIFEIQGGEALPIAALGRWVHVCVDVGSGRPTPVPDDVRALLDRTVSSAPLEDQIHGQS